jgi:hypothetical protein
MQPWWVYAAFDVLVDMARLWLLAVLVVGLLGLIGTVLHDARSTDRRAATGGRRAGSAPGDREDDHCW